MKTLSLLIKKKKTGKKQRKQSTVCEALLLLHCLPTTCSPALCSVLLTSRELRPAFLGVYVQSKGLSTWRRQLHGSLPQWGHCWQAYLCSHPAASM